MEFKPSDIESKWKQYWIDNDTYKVEDDTSKPKFYVLDMFPYPSGSGLHVGHPLGYIASDIYSRYKKMKGYNVLHPMGFDAFGLPAEQYAIQTGVHPAESTAKNIAMYKSQLKNIGFNYDWSREVNTSDPDYYKWTQSIFLSLFNSWYDDQEQCAKSIRDLITHFEINGSTGLSAYHGNDIAFTAEQWNGYSELEKEDILMNYRLAYRKVSYVNWCEALGTVLANDEVKDGLSERGGHPVEKREMMQWSLRITAYAERLLNDLNELEWSDALKAMQRNWIGKSQGSKIYFSIKDYEDQIEVFTTRPDTIFGSTFMVLAPEHDLVKKITSTEQKEEIENYLEYVGSRSEKERMSEVKKVTGAFTGAHAIHPFTNRPLPIWISEYVLKDYGSGAIMAVPSDDDRDAAFAEKFSLEIIEVVDKSMYSDATAADKKGKLINSDFLNGLEVKDAIGRAIEEIEHRELGEGKTNYRLRDANFSRQRYWGEPFPIKYSSEGLAIALNKEELPLELPSLDNFKPTSDGKSPLARVSAWVNTSEGYRETDTMPGYAGSSWYFLRYMDPKNVERFASEEALDYWKEVDLYVGGTEHAVGHLMYSRFWHKFLYDMKLVPTNEPFKKLINQGMIQGVIESLVLLKEKTEGRSHFISRELCDKYDESEYTKIPVYIDYVKDYGSDSSYMDNDSLREFLNWRKEYTDVIFESSEGKISSHDLLEEKGIDIKLDTISEVGKMSKRYFNVINPDDVVAKYGADCFRMYEMFLGPVEQSKPWDTKGIDGVSKFLRRLWSLFYSEQGDWLVNDEPAGKEAEKALHKAIDKVTNDIENFGFNTCVSTFMVAVNELKKLKSHNKLILSELVKLIAPFAPFISEELWEKLGNTTSVHLADYPIFDESKIKEDSVNYPICFNGKKRLEASFPADASREELSELALKVEGIEKYLDGKPPKKIIVVPGRMINMVV